MSSCGEVEDGSDCSGLFVASLSSGSLFHQVLSVCRVLVQKLLLLLMRKMLLLVMLLKGRTDGVTGKRGHDLRTEQHLRRMMMVVISR